MTPNTKAVPRDWLAGLKENWQTDIISGFILFLIALPLSLGIAMASGVPPVAGIIAAVVGGLFVSLVGASHLTINGSAAGLIVVILAAVERLGGGEAGYHHTLGAIVVAGAMMLVLGLMKAGALGQLFPRSVVHGMLAAIGIIIIVKEIPIMLGANPPAREPLLLVARLPEIVSNLNPEVAIIGLACLLLLIIHAVSKVPWIKRLPSPIATVLLGIALGAIFDIDHSHSYSFCGHPFQIDPMKCLVAIPSNPAAGIVHPDFAMIGTAAFWISAVSILLVQGVETLLSSAAVADRLDLYKRRVNLSRDLAAVGAGTIMSATLGGLPMIAEIVRSTANVMNGARTRWSNFFHGLFMLMFVLFAAGFINRIPLSALAALLIVTGYKLAAPKVFRETHALGGEQTIIFVTTIVVTLATDLLIGVMAGIMTKLALHVYHGVPFTSLFKASMNVQEKDGTYLVTVHDAAVFSNFIAIKSKLDKIPRGKAITVDLSAARLVDHTVMERLHQLASDCNQDGGALTITGLHGHRARSAHPLSARIQRDLPSPRESSHLRATSATSSKEHR